MTTEVGRPGGNPSDTIAVRGGRACRVSMSHASVVIRGHLWSSVFPSFPGR